MITQILALWDNSDPAHTAIAKALDIAHKAGANLHVLACVSEPAAPEASDRDITHLSEEIGKFVDEHGREDVQSDIAIRLHHDVAQAVNELSVEKSIDLVVAATSAYHHGDHDPKTWDLIRNTPLPLYLVTREKRKTKPAVLTTIDIDDSDALQRNINTNVLKSARYFSGLFDQRVEAIHNIPMSKVTLELDVFQPGDILNRDGQQAYDALVRILKDNDMSIDKPIVTAGETAKNINRMASRMKADLMVVGSVGRKGIKGFLLGNTVEDVLKHARCNVLVVRP